MKRIFFALTIISLALGAGAQTIEDGLRMSQYYPSGTARYTGMSGAMGAIGGDVSAIGYNPAAIGVFRRGQLMFTPEFSIHKVNSTFRGTATSDFDTKINLSNFGFISSRTKKQTSGLVSFNWGLTYNRMANFNSVQYYEGFNQDNSMIDWFSQMAYNDLATGYYDPYTTGLAEDGGLLEWSEADTAYYTTADFTKGFQQSRTTETSGYLNEWNLAFGGNVSNKVYFGFAIGIQNFYYHEDINHSEEFTDSQPGAWFEYSPYYTAKGSGVNFKTGVIVRPVDFMKLGIGFHTPTYFSVDEEYFGTLESVYYAGTVYPIYPFDDEYKPGIGLYDYKFQNPMRLTTGLGFQIGDIALIDVDYEYVDYSLMRFRSIESADFSQGLKDDVSENLQGASNVRLGAEVRFGPLATRAGAAYMQSPYKSELSKDAYTILGTAGLGFRGKYFFADLAYAYTLNTSYLNMYNVYDVGEQPTVENISTRSRVLMTFGFVF